MSNSSDSSVRHRVLVVDDEPDITGLMSYHLVRAGYRVSTAGNGAEALGAATNELPDLIVVDLMLPGSSLVHAPRRYRRPLEVPERETRGERVFGGRRGQHLGVAGNGR